MKVLVIIPAYNEEKNLESTIANLKKSIEKSKYNIDYIIINDGSTDNTLELCKKNNFNVINLINNLGIGGAVQTGYKYAKENDYDIAIQFDGDGQHNAEYIDKLIEKIEEDNDLVIGSRFIENIEGFKSTKMRRIGIIFLSKLIKICTRKNITDPTSGFRACNKNIIDMFSKDYPYDYPEPDTVVKVIKKGCQVKEIPTKMNERVNGKSSINMFKSIYYMIKVSLSIIISSWSSKEVK